MAMVYYSYPQIAFRYPGLIHFVYLINWLTQLRKWYVYPVISEKLSQLKDGSIVADLGCGEGQFLLPFAKKFPRLQFIALDNNPENIAFIKRYSERFGLNNLFPVCDSITGFEPGNTIDFAWCVGVMHYIEQDDKAVKRMDICKELFVYQPINKKIELAFYKWTSRLFNHYDKQNEVHRIYNQETLTDLFGVWFDILASRQTYGKPGRRSHELYTSIADIIYHANYFIKPFAVIAVMVCYPVILFGMIQDKRSVVQNGNGIMLHLKSKRND